MKSWSVKELLLVLEWARTPPEDRVPMREIASQLGRSMGSVREFLRRALPPGQRPWKEKRRWTPEETEKAHQDRRSVSTRTAKAVSSHVWRRGQSEQSERCRNQKMERASIAVSRVADDSGLSRAAVYRLIRKGLLRSYKGRVAETSFKRLLREHPEVIPYRTLPRAKREWLVLNGYKDPTLRVKRPRTKGIID